MKSAKSLMLVMALGLFLMAGCVVVNEAPEGDEEVNGSQGAGSASVEDGITGQTEDETTTSGGTESTDPEATPGDSTDPETDPDVDDDLDVVLPPSGLHVIDGDDMMLDGTLVKPSVELQVVGAEDDEDEDDGLVFEKNPPVVDSEMKQVIDLKPEVDPVNE